MILDLGNNNKIENNIGIKNDITAEEDIPEDQVEIDVEHYDRIYHQNLEHRLEIIRALKLTEKFITRKKLILVGGMAIDSVLKMKHHKGIYSEDILPDYDVLSDNHYIMAYELAEWLNKAGFKNISVINALHPSTMRVRLYFREILDVTYMPSDVYNIVPYLFYKGMKVVHPHFQIIDQHSALSYLYENSPYETVLTRPGKDMFRYDLIYDKYPLRVLNVESKGVDLVSHEISLDLIEGQCLTAIVALNYWHTEAKKLGFRSNIYTGDFKIENGLIKYSTFKKTKGFVLFSDNIKELYEQINTKLKIVDEKFYNQFLDKIARNCVLQDSRGQRIQIYDNDKKIAATYVEEYEFKFYVANIQHIMMYSMLEYIIISKLREKKNNYGYYLTYLLCREIVEWAAINFVSAETPDADKKLYRRFIPNSDVFGKEDNSISAILSEKNFLIKTGEAKKSILDDYQQPRNIFDRDIHYGRINKKYKRFDYTSSKIFDICGREVEKFL